MLRKLKFILKYFSPSYLARVSRRKAIILYCFSVCKKGSYILIAGKMTSGSCNYLQTKFISSKGCQMFGILENCLLLQN